MKVVKVYESHILNNIATAFLKQLCKLAISTLNSILKFYQKMSHGFIPILDGHQLCFYKET